MNRLKPLCKICSLTLAILVSLSTNGHAQFDRGGAINYEYNHRHSLYLEFPFRSWSTFDKDFVIGGTYRYSLNSDKFLGVLLSFQSRPYGKSILVRARTHFYYQVKEYRYIIACGIDKKFWINNRLDVFITAGFGYTFADHRGAATIDTKDGVTPMINGGLAYKFTPHVFMRLGYQYVNIRTVDGNRVYLAVGGQF